MKNLNILSKAGMLSGLILGILSSARYYVIYTDLDRFLAYGLLSILVIFVSYLYGVVKKQEYEIIAIEDYISDLNVEWRYKNDSR